MDFLFSIYTRKIQIYTNKLDNNEKKYPNTNLVSNEKKYHNTKAKTKLTQVPLNMQKKERNSVSNEKKSQHRRKNKRTKLTNCQCYSSTHKLSSSRLNVYKPKSAKKRREIG